MMTTTYAATEPRCDGSGQMVADWFGEASSAPCPVCDKWLTIIHIDTTSAVIVDHRPHRAEALPMSLDLFA